MLVRRPRPGPPVGTQLGRETKHGPDMGRVSLAARLPPPEGVVLVDGTVVRPLAACGPYTDGVRCAVPPPRPASCGLAMVPPAARGDTPRTHAPPHPWPGAGWTRRRGPRTARPAGGRWQPAG